MPIEINAKATVKVGWRNSIRESKNLPKKVPMRMMKIIWKAIPEYFP